MLEKGNDFWRRLFFRMEKFNLDGPDELESYWHGLRRRGKVFSTNTKEEHL